MLSSVATMKATTTTRRPPRFVSGSPAYAPIESTGSRSRLQRGVPAIRGTYPKAGTDPGDAVSHQPSRDEQARRCPGKASRGRVEPSAREGSLPGAATPSPEIPEQPAGLRVPY